MGRLELLALGACGDHVACAYTGTDAAAFVLLADGVPLCLIGAGAGAARACRHYTGVVPAAVIVLDADPSQTADLAALVAGEASHGRGVCICASAALLPTLQRLLDLQLAGEPDALRESVSFAAIGHTNAPVHIALGVFAAIADGAAPSHRLASPLTLFAGDPGVVSCAAVPLVSFTGPCRPVQWRELLGAPLVVAWAVPDAEGAEATRDPREQLWCSVTELREVQRRWNAGRGDDPEERTRFGLTGFPVLDVAPATADMLALAPATCVPLLVTDDALSPFAGFNLKAVLATTDSARGGRAWEDRDAQSLMSLVGRRRQPAHDAAVDDRRAPPVETSVAAVQTEFNSPVVQGDTVPESFRAGPDLKPMAAGRKPPSSEASGAVASGTRTPSRTGSAPSMIPASSAGVVDSGRQSPEPWAELSGRGRSRYRDGGSTPNRRPATPVSSTAKTSSRSGATATVRRVYVFNNEEKGWPGRMLLAHRYPTLQAFVAAVSDACHVRPVHRLLHANGRPVRDLDELAPDAQLVVTKKGGAPFDPAHPPRLMRR